MENNNKDNPTSDFVNRYQRQYLSGDSEKWADDPVENENRQQKRVHHANTHHNDPIDDVIDNEIIKDNDAIKSINTDKSFPKNNSRKTKHLKNHKNKHLSSGIENKSANSEAEPHLENPEYKWEEGLRLNKFLSNAGITSRRKADALIKEGLVAVNGIIVTEMGYKVKEDDLIMYKGKIIELDKKIYILLNKPKDVITTTEDPEGRRTVLDLVNGVCAFRLYPVGRLDRNTTGLILITNDGELSQKLSHPSKNITKVYQVGLDKPLTKPDFDAIQKGITLEDGFVEVDALAYIDLMDKRNIGIEIHSGKNRIVRRIFEKFGYEVAKLDRTMYGLLTKKDLARGKWRYLTAREINALKMI